VRVLIADDQVAVRSAIRRLLKEEQNITVVGEATNLGELFTVAYREQPDLILLDWELSGFPSAVMSLPSEDPKRRRSEQRRNVVILDLRKLQSHPAVIVLSSHPEVRKISMVGGADAFVLKGGPPKELLAVLRSLIYLAN
jgi:DNA-binding NarL/FixJ family response regulator